jgi:hypothetical protein
VIIFLDGFSAVLFLFFFFFKCYKKKGVEEARGRAWRLFFLHTDSTEKRYKRPGAMHPA